MTESQTASPAPTLREWCDTNERERWAGTSTAFRNGARMCLAGSTTCNYTRQDFQDAWLRGWDGTFSAFSTCGGCVALRDRLAEGEGYAFGELSEEVAESGSTVYAVAWQVQVMRSAMLRGVPVVDLRAAAQEADALWSWSRNGGPFALAIHRPARTRILPGDLTPIQVHVVEPPRARE